ncbi:Dps family protein [Cytobacillus gottheilii]|uniref:DNA starvation/stationary phase protection protein n=1 Tax=Cytobacillus gottheilii TaxID=859144 RepID=A0ABX8FDS2_9BACI|nr:DNA starvation/stationary phase protection protein [Cytobacillus gottheilii]QVY61886.1 DNA starvation/stationary phase protection protein [Cytobacillus gottheilii]
MEKLYSALNVQISNWSVLYTKLHRYHWYVKGPNFFALHAKFEELYNEAANVVDEAAERLLAIGGKPVSTMQEYLNTSTLTEDTAPATASEMVANLAADYTQLKKELEDLAALAADQNDDLTNDFAVGLMATLDTHIWMFNAYLGE